MFRPLINITLAIMLLALTGCMGGSTTPVKKSVVQKRSIIVSSELRTEYAAAVELIKAKKYEEGIAALEIVSSKNDRLVGPHINMGIAYMHLEKYEEGVKALERAVELDPDHVVAKNQLGLLYRYMGRFSDAQNAYQQAIAKKPDYLDAHYNLGILCDLYMQQLECALQHFEQYQLLQTEKDKQVELWIVDLKRRLPKPAAPATDESTTDSAQNTRTAAEVK